MTYYFDGFLISNYQLKTHSQAKASDLPMDIEKQITDIIQPLVDPSAPPQRRYVGAAVGVVKESSQRIFTFGSTSLEKNEKPTPDTIFEIGSITKTFTGFLLADAVIEGTVTLGDVGY